MFGYSERTTKTEQQKDGMLFDAHDRDLEKKKAPKTFASHPGTICMAKKRLYRRVRHHVKCTCCSRTGCLWYSIVLRVHGPMINLSLSADPWLLHDIPVMMRKQPSSGRLSDVFKCMGVGHGVAKWVLDPFKLRGRKRRYANARSCRVAVRVIFETKCWQQNYGAPKSWRPGNCRKCSERAGKLLKTL